jgi:hypothetical protein
MDDDTKALMASSLSTIPRTITPWPSTLDDFNYEYSPEGKLRHKITSNHHLLLFRYMHWLTILIHNIVMTMGIEKPFVFISQRHYDALGDVIVPHIQRLMVNDYKLKVMISI